MTRQTDDILFLDDITGTLGGWLDLEFDDDIPHDAIKHLFTAYKICADKLSGASREGFRESEFQTKCRELAAYAAEDPSLIDKYTVCEIADAVTGILTRRDLNPREEEEE